jgi:hypothetical protein
MSRWSRYPWSAAALVLLAAAAALLADAPPAAAAASAKASPDRGLVNGQAVTISGHGLVHSYGGNAQTWFVVECTAAVRGRMSPANDTSHCDITAAKAIRVAHNGSFSARFHVHTGIIGDGYCGTAGHPSCVIGVGTAAGLGTVVKIWFAAPSTSSSQG